jgi:transposase
MNPVPEQRDYDLNPHRREDRERASDIARSRLRDHEVPLSGQESSDELADILAAVEGFEAAVARRGGDSFTNAPDSDDPDDAAFVLPKRKAAEGAEAYARRVRNAARRLLSQGE